MALEYPLLHSHASMMSAISPYTDFSLSPNSPGLPNTPRFQSLSARSSAEESSLHPNSLDGRSPGIGIFSPSDMVGPSPVTSNGTVSTEIEDDASEGVTEHEPEQRREPEEEKEMGKEKKAEEEEEKDLPVRRSRPRSDPNLKSLSTNLPAFLRTKPEDEPASVIHAPQGYMNFNIISTASTNPPQSPPVIDRGTPKPYQPERRRDTVHDIIVSGDKTITSSPISPPSISTDVGSVPVSIDQITPRAQTRQEIDALTGERLRSSSSSSLEGIPEDARESDDFSDFTPVQAADHEVNALKTALHECWTLCNTLASLSSIHRERIFSYSGTGDAHEKAWKCCWRLCQKLYDSRDDHQDLHVGPTLELCRDFCQSLFDVRQRKDEIADSVLRVSYELNNHLFNTHDRNLPEAFRERTLDFYITLCHRLMKQRSELAEETDSLLRACWSLAEMLFSLRQNRREGKPADEELLGSAVQACWELCDLFREGWTQVRPERGTPRPSQTTFTQSFDQRSRSSHITHGSNSLKSLPILREQNEPRPFIPETPTTDFEDTPISPENSPSIPNLMVLGAGESRPTNRWSSNSSSRSGYSQGSAKSTSTVKTSGSLEDVNLTRLKILILKAAMNVGYVRGSPIANAPNSANSNALQSFVKALPTGSFGSLPWHASLLASYKELVVSDPTFRSAVTLPAIGKHASSADVAKSVGWMITSGQYLWLKDLFRFVLGFQVEEAESRKTVAIIV